MNRNPPPIAVKEKSQPSWWEGLGISFKIAGLLIWLFVLLLGLLEVKRYFNIDVIPNYDSAVDDVYGATRGTIIDWFK